MKITLQLFILLFICSQLHAQIVNIPDPVFKQLLIGNGVDTNHDGEIQVTEAEAVNGLLDVNGDFEDIYDLTGIEAFVNITTLYCSRNALTNIDLSQNTALVHLESMDNPLTSLNVSQCTALEYLESANSQLSGLDVSNNISLKYLSIEHNELISLDLTQNFNLENIGCSNNQLTFLELRNGNNININYFNAAGNPDLTCIFVDSATYSDNNPNWYKDVTSTYVETQVQCDALGLEDYKINNIYIYPNPVKDILSIEGISKLKNANTGLILTDMLGQKLIQVKLLNPLSTIDVKKLQKGIYLLNIYINKKRLLTKKIIKL